MICTTNQPVVSWHGLISIQAQQMLHTSIRNIIIQNCFSHPTRTCIAAELEQTWTDKRETSCAANSENADESGRDAFR